MSRVGRKGHLSYDFKSEQEPTVSVGLSPGRTEGRASRPLGLGEDFGLNFTGSSAGVEVMRFQSVEDLSVCLL